MSRGDACTCPVCNGTGRQPCPENIRGYGQKYGWYGYRADDDTVPCRNCGGQTMGGNATGQTREREDGTACIHEYTGVTRGRCYTVYTCKHCGYSYDIDSGD